MITNMKTAIIPFSCLNDIKNDISEFAQRSDLNNFQKWIVRERYVFKPELDFEPKSIIIAAVGFKLCNAVFHYEGKTVTSVVEVGNAAEEVKNLLSQGNSYHLFFDYWLPQKRLAVRSGLAEYGRNNICYVDGMGSLVTLFVFISDMPCDKEYTWREVKNMDICKTCNLCINKCPTGAILADRFLIDNEKCLTSFNEFGTEPFPDNIPKSVHHRAVGCSRCQEMCPGNKERFENITESVYFSEEETALLLSGTKFEELPKELSEKIDAYGMKWFYGSLPRNLKALFDSVS
jgi:epoxyqueuosine reductase